MLLGKIECNEGTGLHHRCWWGHTLREDAAMWKTVSAKFTVLQMSPISRLSGAAWHGLEANDRAVGHRRQVQVTTFQNIAADPFELCVVHAAY